MVTIGTISQIRGSSMMIDILVDRLQEEHQFMIGWGVGLTYMNGWADVSAIFHEIKNNLRKWQMQEFLMR
jgi:hypothetical protein